LTIQVLNDFHGDGVFRDQTGVIWVRQSEMVEGMARAWGEGSRAAAENVARALWEDGDQIENPYRKEQS